MKSVPHLRIVLASPGDVQAERDEMESIVDDVNHTLRILKYSCHLELWRWETDSHPGLHALGPQGLIDRALQIESCDALVGVFWKRLGTPVADARSGTEHEIRKAIAAWKGKGSPQVMLYFNTAPTNTADTAEDDQVQQLRAFERELLTTVKPLIWQYNGIPDFRTQVRNHLLMYAADIAQRASLGSHSALRFEVVAAPVRVRSEGYTELLGDIFIKCTCSEAYKSLTPLWFSVLLFLNTSVTSRLSIANAGVPALSEALIQEVGRPGPTDAYSGVVNGNSVMFGQIHLTSMQPGETRTFKIANVRCNATMVERVFAAVTVGGMPIGNETPEVAVATRSLHFGIRHLGAAELPNLDGASNSKPQRPSSVASLIFREEFANAFKTRIATSRAPLRADSKGGVYLSESNPSGSPIQLPGSTQFAGIADHGTRLRVHFIGLPSGTRLFVSERNTRTRPGAPQAELVKSVSLIDDGTERWVMEGIELREVAIINGWGLACWM